MNLIELYDSLSPVEHQADEWKLNAVRIPKFPNFRIGIDIEGNPVLLFSITGPSKDPTLKNIKLKYLQLNHNIECRISNGKRIQIETLTSITFTSKDRSLQEHFLTISETLIKGLGNNLTQKSIFESFNRFIEVFRALADTPSKTIHGLWAELFLIDFAAKPKVLLHYWHDNPTERFDFNSGAEKIEVKSSSNFERIHIFSSEQLNPPNKTNAVVASLFVKRINNGKSIQHLVNSISAKITDMDLLEKLNLTVYKTLGNAFEESITIKFDYIVAKESIQFYCTNDIAKIHENFIPGEVSEVKYKSDLSKIEPIELKNDHRIGQLFNAI